VLCGVWQGYAGTLRAKVVAAADDGIQGTFPYTDPDEAATLIQVGNCEGVCGEVAAVLRLVRLGLRN
jgi:hypothetical protein